MLILSWSGSVLGEKMALEENIEEFLVYFEAYAASKDWNNDKKVLVVILHIADRLKPSMMQLIKANSTLRGLKKMDQLKNKVQKDDDSVQMYTNCFDAYVKEIDEQLRDLEKREWYIQGLQNLYQEKIISLCPEMYEEAKKLAVKIEKAQLMQSLKENKLIGNKAKGISAIYGATTVCHVGEGHISNMDRIDRMETSITELTRVIQTLVEERRNPVQQRGPAMNTLQNRSGENRSRSSTPHKTVDRSNSRQNDRVNDLSIRGADVRLFEVIEKIVPHEEEYLMVHVDEDEKLFDIRNLGKRRRSDVGVTTRASKRRKVRDW
ncbi:16928_t:CDS:2 [Gigaspora margarita]|uniref:16928_t:CDS:1 n=1 Tax=Gigaspora margarita TaxID=4874 RepID=A0ABN7VQG4_GIGMA|nr:16928_t:CDS:2 [Gigaspora margarita]